MVLDLRLSKDWDVEMTSFLFFTLFPTLFWTALSATETIWNYLKRPPASGTREAHLERPPGPWNARSANGTEPWLYLERAKRNWNHMERPPAFWNRASGSTWNARSASGTAARLLRPLYCSLAGDNISVLLSLGTAAERLRLLKQPIGLLDRAKRLWPARLLEREIAGGAVEFADDSFKNCHNENCFRS